MKSWNNMPGRPRRFRAAPVRSRPAAEAALAEVGGEPVGFALWFATFSTFRGQPGLYLEDIFVKPSYRGRGIGKGLLAAVARQAVERGLRTAGMVGAQLERSRDRLLPVPRCAGPWTSGQSTGSMTSRCVRLAAIGARSRAPIRMN